MKYRFENVYTPAESIKWQMAIADGLDLNPKFAVAIQGFMAGLIQFVLWATVFNFLYYQSLPIFFIAFCLFGSFFLISTFYDRFITPHIIAYFTRRQSISQSEKCRAIIDINDEEIRAQEAQYAVIFKWSDIRKVEDNEKTVFLLTKTGGCTIPARCFPGFLEKDAFVRACREKISGYTEQGEYFS